MNNKVEKVSTAVSIIATEVSFILKHLADPIELRDSDRSRMRQIAESLDQLSEELQQ